MSGRRDRGGAATRGARVTAVVATLAAPFLLYLAVRTAIVGLYPATAATLPPATVAPLLRPLVTAAAVPQQKVSAEMVALSQAGALSAPLSFEPFFIVAKAQEQAGRLPSAIRLMEESKRRRPNHLFTRLQLTAYYQQAGRVIEMVDELDWVLRASSEARRFILPEITKLVGDPRGRRALAVVLARDPEWREELMRVARQQPIAPADAKELLDLVRARRGGGNAGPEQALYLHRLLAAGEHGRARAVWLETLPAAERGRHQFLFNGGFRAVSAEPPFGWSLTDASTGRAEIVASGTEAPYLDVAYFGGSNATFAEQALALPPGRYRIGMQAKSEDGISSGEIFWTVSCLPAGPELARIPLAGLAEGYRAIGAGFTVPAGCPGQRLRLSATPGDASAAVNLQIANLEVRP